jgi:WD and tetratricopeptide repeat-containing protein 1
LFWSAAEDGMVRQYDLRAPNQKVYGSPNVLINMATAGPQSSMVECKGLDLNPVNPNLLAVACGDPYVRVFDRRQLSPGDMTSCYDVTDWQQ